MDKTEGLKCLNCHKVIQSGDAKIFAEVLVCPTCWFMSTRLYERAQQDLRRTLVIMREVIRLALVQGKLQFWSADQIKGLSRSQLLEQLAVMSKGLGHDQAESGREISGQVPDVRVGHVLDAPDGRGPETRGPST